MLWICQQDFFKEWFVLNWAVLVKRWQANKNKIEKKIHLNFFSGKLDFWLRVVWPFLPKEHQKFLNKTQNMNYLMGSCNQLFKIPLLLNRQYSQAQSIPHNTTAQGSHDTRTEIGAHQGTLSASKEVCWRTARAQHKVAQKNWNILGLSFPY